MNDEVTASRIRKGTPILTGEALCESCSNFRRATGPRLRDVYVTCEADMTPSFKVLSCTSYENRHIKHPDYKNAWLLRVQGGKFQAFAPGAPGGFSEYGAVNPVEEEE